jgi:hypothetical protein
MQQSIYLAYMLQGNHCAFEAVNEEDAPQNGDRFVAVKIHIEVSYKLY